MINRLLRKKFLFDLSCFLLFFTVWYLLSRKSINPFFPPLNVLLTDAFSYWTSAEGMQDMQHSLWNITQGLVFGILAGSLFGLIIGQIHWLYLALTPTIELLRSIPNVILIPITISFLGIGDEMKTFNIMLGVFWPVLINTIDGIPSIPQQYLQTARIFDFGKWTIQRYIVLPAVIPHILTGIHVAIPLSLIIAVTTEMVGSTIGIGSTILNSQYTYNVERMWSGVILLGLIGYSMNTGFAYIRSSILKKIH